MRGIALLSSLCVAMALWSAGIAQRQTKPTAKEALNAALFQAIKGKDLARSRALLDQGANPNAVDSYQDTPLFVAEVADSLEIAQLLVDRGAKPDGYTVLVALNSPKLLKLILDHGGDPNFTPPVRNPESDMAPPKGVTVLMGAAMLGNIESMTLLIDKGARLGPQDEEGRTALTYAMTGGFVPRGSRPGSGMDAVKLLLDRGAPLDKSTKGGDCDLVVAVSIGNVEFVQMLLAHGASINRPGKNGITALYRAVGGLTPNTRVSYATSITLIKLLLDQGADPATVRKPIDGFPPEVMALLTTSKLYVAPARRLPEPDRNLLDLAKPIPTMKDSVIAYTWQSDRTLLMMPTGKPGSGKAREDWEQHDLNTSRTKALPALTYAGMEMVVSPDGKWALDDYGGSASIEFSAFPLTGAESLKRSTAHKIVNKPTDFASSGSGDLVWMRDSRRWLWYPNVGSKDTLSMYLYGLDSQRRLRTLPVSLPQRNPSVNLELWPHPLLGITADGRGLLTSGEGSEYAVNAVELFTFALDGPSTAKGTVFTLPARAVCSPALSPAGDRIAWTLYVEHNGRHTVEIWVCKIDGSDTMHPIGKQQVTSLQQEGALGNVRWLPGGKRLSFTYKDRIYTLPVDP